MSIIGIELHEYIISGQKGRTVCYEVKNLSYSEEDKKIKWYSFPFYTPVGELTDEEGYNYFPVPGDEILIERDPLLDKTGFLRVNMMGSEYVEVFEGAAGDSFHFYTGLSGDIIATIHVPCDPDVDITCTYKRVIDGREQ